MLNGRYAVLLTALAVCGCGSAHEQTINATAAPPGSVNQSQSLLEAMSRTLSAAPAFTLRATREIDAALTETGSARQVDELYFEVRRPDRLHMVSRTKEATQHLYFDGESIVLYNESDLVYATMPMQGTIDSMITALHESIGYVPPLAQFVLNDSWPAFQEQLGSSSAVSNEAINGVECRRLRLMGMRAIAYIWIARQNNLPCALTATFADVAGDPQVRIRFLEWNFAAQLSDAVFHFTPPAGARVVPMAP